MNDPTLFDTPTTVTTGGAATTITTTVAPTPDEYRAQLRAAAARYHETYPPRTVAATRPTDPDTSRQAAASLNPDRMRDTQRRVLEVLRRFGPATDEQIATRFADLAATEGWPPQSPSGLRTRRAELVDAGLVVDTGRRGKTSTGRQTIVWELSAGRA